MRSINIWLVIVGALAIAIALGSWWWTRAGRAGHDEPMVAFVLLLSQPRQLDAADVAAAVKRAWEEPDEADQPDTDDAVMGQPPHFIVRAGKFAVLVNVFPEPYVSEPEREAEQIADLRLRQAFAAHRAWLSAGLLGPLEGLDRQKVYQHLGKLIAELVDDDCLAIYATETGNVNVISDEVLEHLRGDDPLAGVKSRTVAPVIGVPEDDPRMAAAVAEARRRWPEFVSAFANRRDDQVFSIKAPITVGGNTEFIWIVVTSIDGDVIRGTLGNEPMGLQGLSVNDTVSVELKDLNDWMYEENGKFIGGFTVELLMGDD